jgi:hypothetical protein
MGAIGITGTAEIAAELTKRGIKPPTTDDCWNTENVCRVYMSNAWRRAGLLPTR